MGSHRIEIATRDEGHDSTGRTVAENLRAAGMTGVTAVRHVRVTTIGGVDAAQAGRAAAELLADAVVDQWQLDADVLPAGANTIVEITRRPGVMDPTEASVRKGLRHLGIEPAWVVNSTKYLVGGQIADAALRDAAARLLANDLIEEITVGGNAVHSAPQSLAYTFQRVDLPLAELDDTALETLSQQKQLYLSLPEMRCIQAHFSSLGRAPTDIELETIAQTWSEHCVHKTLKGRVRYSGPEGTEVIDNLLKMTIARVTTELDKPWCLSVFKDNAGIIAFDEEYGAAFKVETHNHPSALEPYGGAGTGTGGVIRDCLGTGLGAKPVMNTDVFCFGPPDLPPEAVPKGALHPKRVLEGVVGGVRDYGNRMGIPTANGALYFDKRYIGNPLVFCGTVGIIPRHQIDKEARPGQAIVVVGGRTGRDGIHGATFSSVELHEESETVSSGAVQIGNPIEEKKVRDFLLRARDAGLYSCVTDCGAGGLSSAVGEMGAECGAAVDLDAVPLKYDGLSYTEIWISEAQERMVFAADPEKLEALGKLAREEDVEMTVIGHFTDDGLLHLRSHGAEVGCLQMGFLHDGVPRIEREATWSPPETAEPTLPQQSDYTDDLKAILGAWNVCSKEWVIRQYDHEVQGNSVIKPLVGVDNDGPGDAAVIAPRFGSTRGLAVACGVNPKYSDLDPYAMAAAAIDEAVRNIIAVGGSLDTCALLDNYCWGNCDKPDRLGGLVRASKACYDVARVYGLPFISGKDSLNNEFATAQGAVAIPGTLLISALAVMADVTRAVTMDLKGPGHLIYLVGHTYDELGAGHWYALHNELGAKVPQVRPAQALRTFRALSAATAGRLVRSLHDLSEGGLATAAAEMAFAGGFGMALSLGEMETEEELATPTLLFSESQSRFLAEVEPAMAPEFEALLTEHGVHFSGLGAVTRDPELLVRDLDGQAVIQAGLAELKAAWQAPLTL